MHSVSWFCRIAASLLFLTSQGCQMDSKLLSARNGEETDGQAFKNDENAYSEQPEANESRHVTADLMNDWEAVIDDSHHHKLVNPIRNARQLKQVWAICHPDKVVPDVDFDRNWVYLCASDAGDPNKRGMYFDRQADGTIRSQVITTLIGHEPTERTKVQFYVVQLN